MADEEDEQAEPLEEQQGEEAKPDEEQVKEEDPVQDQPIKEEAPPPSPAAPSDKKKRIQVDLNASLKDTADNTHYLSALPAVPEEARPYTPILYTFRLKTKNKNTQLKHITTKPPPFYLQFDHTIAVIWTLFNKESNRDNLGIVQLQWAFYFLNSIFNSEGVHPRDVQLCIDTIQDYLIDEYADMSEESVIYGSEASGEKGAAINLKVKDVNLPFSINYSQMIEKAPAFTVDTDTETDLIDHHLLEELENIKRVAGIESIDLTKVVSKDQVMNILNDWKNEQIGKIQEELKMLFVVEDMMKNSDEQNFEGYTDEKQFETIFKRNQENKENKV